MIWKYKMKQSYIESDLIRTLEIWGVVQNIQTNSALKIIFADWALMVLER